MSSAALTTEREGDPAAIKAMLRGRKSSDKLYWRLKRPSPWVYALAVIKVILYRLVAAAVASLAITLCVFLGVTASNVGNLRWPSFRGIQGRTFTLADVHAIAGLGRWLPVSIVFGLVLVGIPRPHRWIFSLTMLGSALLGYYHRYLPPAPYSALTANSTKPAASLAARILLKASMSPIVALILLAAIVLLACILYRTTYSLTIRTMWLIPRRPINHYRSAFRGVSVLRRLAAVPVTAGVLSIELWIVENIRARLPDAHFGIHILGYSQSSVAEWLLATIVVALITCMPRPQGLSWPLYVLPAAIAFYAFLPHVRLLRTPIWIPTASNSFWVLAVAYILVTGFGVELVAALLDWA